MRLTSVKPETHRPDGGAQRLQYPSRRPARVSVGACFGGKAPLQASPGNARTPPRARVHRSASKPSRGRLADVYAPYFCTRNTLILLTPVRGAKNRHLHQWWTLGASAPDWRPQPKNAKLLHVTNARGRHGGRLFHRHSPWSCHERPSYNGEPHRRPARCEACAAYPEPRTRSVSGRYPGSPRRGTARSGREGGAYALGVLVLALVTSGTIKALIECFKTYLAREHALTIKLTRADGTQVEVTARDVDTPAVREALEAMVSAGSG